MRVKWTRSLVCLKGKHIKIREEGTIQPVVIVNLILEEGSVTRDGISRADRLRTKLDKR